MDVDDSHPTAPPPENTTDGAVPFATAAEEVLGNADLLRCVFRSIKDANPDLWVRTMEGLLLVSRLAHSTCHADDAAWNAVIFIAFKQMMTMKKGRLTTQYAASGVSPREYVKVLCEYTAEDRANPIPASFPMVGSVQRQVQQPAARFRHLYQDEYQKLAQSWAAASPFDPNGLKSFVAWSHERYEVLPEWKKNIFRACSAKQMSDLYEARFAARRALRRAGHLY